MKQLNGFDKAKTMNGGSTQLPKGGYVAQIKACEEITGEKNGNSFSYLAFSFDIAEGEHKDHWTNVYKDSTDENKKWRGTHNAFIPQEGTDYYEDNLVRFKTMISNFEESNNDFHWGWDEKQLTNKYIGIVYREKEFKTNEGEVITITEPCGFRSVDCIRNGKYKVPQIKKLKGYEAPAASGFAGFIPVAEDDDDLPF